MAMCVMAVVGVNRSVGEIVNAALQQDVQGVAITSYQGTSG